VHAYCVQFRGVSFIIQNITHKLDNRSFLTFLEMPNTFLCTSQTGSVANRLGSKVRRLGCIILFTSTSTSCLCPQLTLGISRSPLLTKHTTCPLQSTLFALFYLTNCAQPCSFSVTIRGFSCITPRVCGFRHSEGGSCISYIYAFR